MKSLGNYKNIRKYNKVIKWTRVCVRLGAGLGRLVGEVAAVVLPEGVHSNGTVYSLIPGSYAVAGNAPKKKPTHDQAIKVLVS